MKILKILALVLTAVFFTYSPAENSIEAKNKNDTSFEIYLPLAVTSGEADDIVLDQYVIVLQNDLVEIADVNDLAIELTNTYGGDVVYQYDNVLKGFTISNASEDIIADLETDSRVASVEQDHIFGVDTTTGNAVSWGLDRIDQHNLPLDGNYTYGNTGANVYVYIMDTGILASHNEFGGRVHNGYDAIDGNLSTTDCHGHGTHVAGIVGGNSYGVAKEVQLIPVRVLNCDGFGQLSNIIEGINWITEHHLSNPSIPAIVNMSLSRREYSHALNKAIANSASLGVTYIMAAGNDNTDACNALPAKAIIVGATTSSDIRASRSNFGGCLALFAPGDNILSAWSGGNNANQTLSGTSMAAPYVAGVAALYLQSQPSASPVVVADVLIQGATADVISNPGNNSPNLLLYSRFPHPVNSPTWYLRNSNNSGWADVSFYYGLHGDIPVMGDWNGDGIDTPGVFRSDTATWYLRNSNNSGLGELIFPYGVPGDIPVVGDWNGDGVDSVGVFRNNTATWYLRNSNNPGPGELIFPYGASGDIPVVGDWNGDGVDSVGVFRNNTATWYLRNSNNPGPGELIFPYGVSGDTPIVGDWNGDGVDSVGVFQNVTATWHLRNSNDAGPGEWVFPYGAPNDRPIVGDWNNNGVDTPGVVQ